MCDQDDAGLGPLHTLQRRLTGSRQASVLDHGHGRRRRQRAAQGQPEPATGRTSITGRQPRRRQLQHLRHPATGRNLGFDRGLAARVAPRSGFVDAQTCLQASHTVYCTKSVTRRCALSAGVASARRTEGIALSNRMRRRVSRVNRCWMRPDFFSCAEAVQSGWSHRRTAFEGRRA